jgi:uncharacterized repeat protein (TIGR03803 family)
MTPSVRRAFPRLLLGVLPILATRGAAEVAIVQLTNLTPAAGRIVVDVPSVSCDTTCTVAVTSGATLTLTAAPSPGGEFDAWSGDCSGSAARCTLVMDGAKVAVASFKPAGDPLTTVHRFMAPMGYPCGSLMWYAGALYGMTRVGGAADSGVVFRIDPDGSAFTILHSFTGGPSDGSNGSGSLIEYEGALYGMTFGGGSGNDGTVFKVSPDGGAFAVLHSFTGHGSDGSWPFGSLLVLDGVLYGMTYGGGANTYGTVFKVDPDGSDYTLLHSFAGSPSGGSGPTGALIEYDGALYGMTSAGGAADGGTVFKVNPNGTGLAVLHSFTGGGSDGSAPFGSLLPSGGVLYGMTWRGGASNLGTFFRIGVDGNGFEVLHSFGGGASDGSFPSGALLEADGALYGMTALGGAGDLGTIFKTGPDGSGFALLHGFAGADGACLRPGVAFEPVVFRVPLGSLTPLDGSLYAVTTSGGFAGGGVLVRLDTPQRRVQRHLARR